MNILTNLLKKITGRSLTNVEQIEFLKKGGAHIGKELRIYGGALKIDKQMPYMLHIGDYVEITDNVKILCHDYSWCVIKRMSGVLMGGIGPVWIGDNVFIGTNTTILMNTHIGNNSIVGAGSVVHGTFPDNSVIAGNPARVICSIEEYSEKREKRQLSEAVEIVRCYRRAFGCNPPKEKLPAYFWLFEPRNSKITNPTFHQRMSLKNNYSQTLNNFLNSKPLFKSYEDFLKNIDNI